ncbi:MAG: helix-turn-helix domain-containing protein, partial [Candidatus Nealsonbacteria bacterium]
MQEINEFLSKLKLNSKEIKVYLVGLKNGPMHASDIAKECELSRPNAYDIVKKLQDKGLCHQLGSAYGRKFKMSSDKELKELIERQKKQSEELENNLENILPLIQGIQGKFYEPYPQIEFFQGVEGIRQILEKSLQCEKKNIDGALSVKNWVNFIGKDFTNYYVKKRIEHNVTTRTLRLKGGEINEPFYKKHKEQKRHVRYAPTNMKLDASILLWDDKVALITTKKENVGILMHSKDYSST